MTVAAGPAEGTRTIGELSAADFTDTGGCLIALMSPRIVAGSVRSWAADAPRAGKENA